MELSARPLRLVTRLTASGYGYAHGYGRRADGSRERRSERVRIAREWRPPRQRSATVSSVRRAGARQTVAHAHRRDSHLRDCRRVDRRSKRLATDARSSGVDPRSLPGDCVAASCHECANNWRTVAAVRFHRREYPVRPRVSNQPLQDLTREVIPYFRAKTRLLTGLLPFLHS